jgi:hypothetical protein
LIVEPGNDAALTKNLVFSTSATSVASSVKVIPVGKLISHSKRLGLAPPQEILFLKSFRVLKPGEIPPPVAVPGVFDIVFYLVD